MRNHASLAQREHDPEVAPARPRARAAIVRWLLATAGVAAVVLGLLVWPVGVAAMAAPHVVAGGLAIVAIVATAVIAGRAGVAAAGEVTIHDAAAEFLAKKRIAVTGVSREPGSHGSNVVYRRLRELGYEVFAINPNAKEVEGDRSYPDLPSIPGGVDAVVIATRADRALPTMRACADLGVRHVWMHRSVGAGSVSDEATAWGRQRGIRVIPGGCPLMFGRAADPGHKVMRTLCTLTGKVPRHV